jgi:hypothetical protein
VCQLLGRPAGGIAQRADGIKYLLTGLVGVSALAAAVQDVGNRGASDAGKGGNIVQRDTAGSRRFGHLVEESSDRRKESERSDKFMSERSESQVFLELRGDIFSHYGWF